MLKLSKLATAVALVVAGSAVFAGEVEVLHWWTSGGEAKSVGELKSIMQGKGHTWKDFAVWLQATPLPQRKLKALPFKSGRLKACWLI